MSKDPSVTGVDRRGELVAVFGLIVSLLGAVLLAWLGLWSRGSSTAVWAAAFQMLGTLGIWILCYIQLHQQRLVAEERLDVEALERERQEKLGGAKTIFDEEDLDQMERLAMGRRLRSIERFLIPLLALVTAVFLLAAGVSISPWLWQFPPIAEADTFLGVVHAEVILFFTGGVAFAAFMVSRYALGMSRLKQWSALRAGGNFMFGSSAICLAISLALLCEISGLQKVESWVGQALGVLLILLAVETAANFILDFYRPRVAGEHHRPFYDSRLLGVFSEPGGVLRSVANAIDYQFGFKVSETWFYKLLGRAILPLLLVQIIVILALTCIVVVPPGHQAVIERFGRPLSETAKPGIHLTWSWPIDRATIIPVDRIQRMVLGHVEEDEQADDHDEAAAMEDRPPVLWTKAHFHKEYQLLVADRLASADTKVPVNLLSVAMPVQWRVKHGRDADVIQYHSQSEDVAGIVESLAYRELMRYAASADISDLLGRGGIETSSIVHQRLQAACDRAGYNGRGLGVEVVYVGIGGVHPPPDEDVAKAYEEVVSAIENKEAAVKKAVGDAAEMRIVSGGVHWRAFYEAIVEEDAARVEAAGDLPEKTAAVERLLRTVVGGEARMIAADAEQKVYARLFGEMSAAESYVMQIGAFEEAKYTYMLRIYLRMMVEALRDVRKYVIVMEDPSRVIYELDLKPASAIDVLGAEISAGEREAFGQ